MFVKGSGHWFYISFILRIARQFSSIFFWIVCQKIKTVKKKREKNELERDTDRMLKASGKEMSTERI